jgi:hypothetical protein
MDKELQELHKFYDNAFAMMATQGWLDLMEDIDRVRNSYDKLSSVTETHNLDFRRGQMDILNWLYGLKSSYEKTFEQIKEESTNG